MKTMKIDDCSFIGRFPAGSGGPHQSKPSGLLRRTTKQVLTGRLCGFLTVRDPAAVLCALACAFTLGAASFGQAATTYPDSTGDEFTGFAFLDIANVEVSNNASDLIFKINLNGDPVANNWGKYCIGIDVDGGGLTGDPNGCGWNRPISMSSGMDYWIGSWVDGGNGMQLWAYSSSWSLAAASGQFAGLGGIPQFDPGFSITVDSSSVTIVVPLSAIGLSTGDSVLFDAYTTGGTDGDGAVDAAANPLLSVTSWNEAYDSGANVHSYTIESDPCAPIPPGLISWWRAEGDAQDGAGSHHGTLLNGATLAAGKVGQAFNLDGVDDYVSVPQNNSILDPATGFTVEFWANLDSVDSSTLGQPGEVFIAQDDGGGNQAKWAFILGGGILTLHINGPGIGPRYPVQSPFAPETGRWYHLAVTFDSGLYTIYVDGVAASSATDLVPFPLPVAPVTLGQAEGLGFIDGRLDEASIFNRALTASEIQSIYAAGSAGKCVTPCVAPFITTEPAVQSVCPNTPVSFSVQASGTEPLGYQWFKGGVELPGETSATLTLPAAQAGDVGTYTVRISNACGNVESAGVQLTLTDSPPDITLNGAADLLIEACVGSYAEPGATALDDCDGPLAVVVGGDAVNTSVPGTYVVNYSATDSANQTTTVIRTVNVADTIPPVFTSVPADLTLACGPDNQTDIDAWLAGAAATDGCGIDAISSSIAWPGPCNSGSALVTWTATDVNGKVSTATATLTVNPDLLLTGVEFVEHSLQLTLPGNGLHAATVVVSNKNDCPTVIASAQIAASFSLPVLTVVSPTLPITLCPHESLELQLQIDTVDALEGDYAATLSLQGQNSGSQSLPIQLAISGQLLPDISANYTGGGVRVQPDTSPVFPVTGEGFTINATVKNIGTAAAGAFTVKFFEGANLLGTAAVAGLGIGQTTTAEFAVPAGFADGWYLIRAEVVPPAGGELRLKNNNASALLQVGTPPIADAFVLITGSVTPDCALTAGTLSLHAEYVLVTGDSSVSYPMQGAYVTATVVGTGIEVSGQHTDINGNLTTSIGLPAAGNYDVVVEVTDFTITGQETVALVVPASPNCVQGGVVEAPGTPDPHYPAESVDLYVCSGDVSFRAADGVTPLSLPATPGETVQICASVQYYTSAGRELNAQPVNFVARRQMDGTVQEIFIGTALANFAGGGAVEVCVPWTVPAAGTYSILVSVSPNVNQGTANDTATRGFIVGNPPVPDMVLRVVAEGAGCGGSGQWVSGRATYATLGAPSLPVICGQVSVTAYDSMGVVVGNAGGYKTDAAGNFYFRPGINLPYGVNRMVVTVTDGTLTGTTEFTIECRPSENVPAPGTPPQAQGDLYVFAEHLAFLGPDCLSALNRNPLPGEAISVNADIHYWDNGSGLQLSAVPVDVNVLIPSGNTLLTVPVGSTTVNFDFGGGSEVICVPWTPVALGPQIIQVVIDPDATYTFPFTEYAGNNAATKLIYVGQLDCLLTAVPGEAQVQAGQSAVYTIAGETLGGHNPTLQLSLVSDSPTPTPGVGYLLGANQMTLPDETMLTLTTTAATPSGTYYFNVLGTGDNCSAIARVKLVVVNNTPPVVTIEQPASGFLSPINQYIPFRGTFTDDGPAGTHTAQWIVWSATLPATSVSGTVTDFSVNNQIQFPEAGVYSIKLVVTDAQGASGEATKVLNDLPAYVVIYDPDGGFVTGGGWIWSPVGAFHPDLSEFEPVEGKANFGFVAKYKKGATIPTGQTEFQFKAGDLNFHSSAYQWLVVAGARAQYKGTGTINGSGNYGFMITGIDGQINGGGGADRFRIKIWDMGAGVIYDNQAGTGDDAELDDLTILQGGSIVIHKK